MPAGAQDQQFPIASGELAGEKLAAERQPLPEQARIAHERLEDVRRRTSQSTDSAQQLAGLVTPLIGGERGDTGLFGSRRPRPGELAFRSVTNLTPEEPHEAGVPEKVADQSHEEGARILADEARDRLKERGFN